MNRELKRTAKENTLVSWLESSSKAPIPSVSITIMFMGVPSCCCPFMGVPQIQSPLVHGFTVGPTPKPFYLSSIILFMR